MSHNIDPSMATVDFDAVSVTDYTFTRAPEIETTVGMFSPGIHMQVVLNGGLGRIVVDGRELIVDEVESVEVAGLYSDLSEHDRVELDLLLRRWKDMNLPLRFLDFGDQAMLLEDEGNFVLIPAGPRNVRLS